MMSLTTRTIWLVVFSAAMGFLETAVVIYLRYLYYPNGFQFPLVLMSAEAGLVEILREAATVIMLASIGILAGHNARQRFAFFLIAFATWDLFYYVFLKLVLNWPASLLTWDILFLIPAPWVGPVLSPILICIAMLALSAVILLNEHHGVMRNLKRSHWVLILAGSLVVVTSWMWDYIAFSGHVSDTPEKAFQVLASYVPAHFNWWMFGLGEGLILVGIVAFYNQSRRAIS